MQRRCRLPSLDGILQLAELASAIDRPRPCSDLPNLHPMASWKFRGPLYMMAV